eukprot:1140232-Rhodomonas_salina.2
MSGICLRATYGMSGTESGYGGYKGGGADRIQGCLSTSSGRRFTRTSEFRAIGREGARYDSEPAQFDRAGAHRRDADARYGPTRVLRRPRV